ncbi:MAG: hypothetical protein Q8N03_11300 [Ignavibacteria bacterium]|nr:hypothetical protein [Ignavibacteria bacterium]MDP3831614.1 hypothetical protein [Ignavibacteriaceae bacterium]
MKKIFLVLMIGLISLSIFNGCEDRTELTAPVEPAFTTGSADFTRVVSIGNSLTAGFQSNALFESAQKYSFGSLIAKQTRSANYVQPLISDPGYGGKINLTGFSNTTPPRPMFSYSPAQGGTPLLLTHAAPYNNLGVPGAILYDVMDTTDFATKSVMRANPFFQLVLRNPALGKSIFEQAKNLAPTFLLVWIGNNDVLGYATSGGTRGTDATGKLPSNDAVFGFLYNQMVTRIATELPNTKAVFGNIPNVTSVPYFKAVGPSVAVEIKKAQAVYPTLPGLVYAKTDAPYVGVATVEALASFQTLLTLTSSTYASYLGQPTGKYYVDKGLAIPAGVDTTKPFGFDPTNPFPNEFVLDPDEMTIANNAVTAFNNTISTLVSANTNFALFDANAYMTQLSATGLTIDGIGFGSSFITGGVFSYDGVHLSDQGNAIVANQIINVINTKFSAAIPRINLSTIPGMKFSKKIQLDNLGLPIFPVGALDNLYL